MWLSVGIVLVCLLLVVGRARRRLVPPAYPRALPFIGHGHLFASTPYLELVKDMSRTAMAWGGVLRFELGPRNTYYMITDPDDFQTIANSCLEKDYVYEFIKLFIGDGLLTAKVSTWKSHRKLLMPAFNQVVLDGFIGVFNSQGKKLVENLERRSKGTTSVEFYDLVDHNAFETICLTAMGGVNANELLNRKFLAHRAHVQEILMERFKRLWWHSDFIFNLSSYKKSFDEASKILKEGSNAVIQKKKKELQNNSTITEKSGTKFKTFLDLILELPKEKGLSDQEIREEVDTIIITGHETTAISLTYTLMLLGSHPDVQERAFKEISDVIGDRDVEKQDLSQLVYLDAVIKESLRLYPIGPVVARRITQDVKITNYTLPAGSGVYLGIWALHTHKMWGADAEQFVPARWLERAIPDHPAAYAPFSLGKRNCIGKTYSMMGMKTTLVHLIRNFRFTADISKLKLKLEILMEPNGGHQICIEKRK